MSTLGCPHCLEPTSFAVPVTGLQEGVGFERVNGEATISTAGSITIQAYDDHPVICQSCNNHLAKDDLIDLDATYSSMEKYDSVDDLHEQVQHYYDEISNRVDDEVLTYVDVDIEAQDDRVELVCTQDDDAPTLEATSGTWGTSPLERVYDVFVDAIQSAGRHLEPETGIYEARDTGKLVVYAPLESNPQEIR